MRPIPPDDELAEMFRVAYGGEASVVFGEDGSMDLYINPASGGSIQARLEDMDSPILRVLLGGGLVPGEADPGGS